MLLCYLIPLVNSSTGMDLIIESRWFQTQGHGRMNMVFDGLEFDLRLS